MDKEIINTVGTVITIVALVMAVVIGGRLVQILSGIGIVYTMFFHDEYLKSIWHMDMAEKKSKEKVVEDTIGWVDGNKEEEERV